MDLKVDLANISVYIEPNPLELIKKQYLQLNIKNISVRNQALYRNYVIDSAEKCVLV